MVFIALVYILASVLIVYYIYIHIYVCGVVVFLSPILILEGLQLLPAKQLGESMTEYLRFAMVTE